MVASQGVVFEKNNYVRNKMEVNFVKSQIAIISYAEY